MVFTCSSNIKTFKNKKVSATEICNSLINHIEEINPKINAFTGLPEIVYMAIL